VEGLVVTEFWSKRRVLLTGHTGFKGSWLAAWLHRLGAEVTGYALEPPTNPSLFDQAGLKDCLDDRRRDVRDAATVADEMEKCRPEVVFHLAAQSLVRASYDDPVGTYATNVMGTVHVLEAARKTKPRVVVVVTSDKCYENREVLRPYSEDDPLGGHDPYSSSKGCAEIVSAAYRRSFGGAIATVRAGNVIGGGDWANDRIVPDCVRAFRAGQSVQVRNPAATRPWQHVLEPLHGYLLLARRMWDEPERFGGAWNFGPNDEDVVAVRVLVDKLAKEWRIENAWSADERIAPHEAQSLRLDSTKARKILGWKPKLRLDEAIRWIADWHRSSDARGATMKQIDDYQRLS
jgi:CDP-glucose 4,6-dehydratase